MTRSEAILAAVQAEVVARGVELNADDTLHSVNIIITLSARTGLPCRVLFRTESQRDLPAALPVGRTLQRSHG